MKSLCCSLGLTLALLAGNAAAAERLYLVELTDQYNATFYKIMGLDEYQACRKDMAQRNKLLPKAMSKAKQEWQKQGMSGAFPSGVASLGTVKSKGLFTSQEKADTKKRYYEQKIERRLADDGNKRNYLKTEIKKLEEDLRLGGGRRAEIRRQNMLDDLARLRKELARQQAKEEEKQMALMEGRNLYEQFLGDLMAAARKKKAAAAAPGP